MSTYKRWFPPLVVIDGVALAPAVLLATNHRKRHEKQEHQLELRAWEGEGGNPPPPDVRVQASLRVEQSETGTAKPPFEKRVQR